MRIETPRLLLDPLSAQDAPALAAIAGHPEVAPMLMIFPTPCDAAFARDVIARSGDASRPDFRLAVREGGRLIGSVGIGGDIPGDPASVAYFIAPGAQGRGLATEAMRAFLSACRAAFAPPVIHADHFEDNPASGRVLARLGFRAVGRREGRSAARPGPAPMIRWRLDAAALPARIATGRLLLRPVAEADLPAVVEGAGDLEVSRWLGRVPHPYGAGDARRFLAWSGDAPGVWAIEEGGAFRGVVSIREDLGYWLARDAWGRGLMTEAARAATRAWFEAGHGALTSSHMEGNGASRTVLIRLGFADVGPKTIPCLALGRDVPGRAMRLDRGAWEAA